MKSTAREAMTRALAMNAFSSRRGRGGLIGQFPGQARALVGQLPLLGLAGWFLGVGQSDEPEVGQVIQGLLQAPAGLSAPATLSQPARDVLRSLRAAPEQAADPGLSLAESDSGLN